MKLYVSPACAATRLRPSETVRMSASVTICKSSVSFFGAASILAINSLPINSWKACSMLWPKNFPDKVHHLCFLHHEKFANSRKRLTFAYVIEEYIPHPWGFASSCTVKMLETISLGTPTDCRKNKKQNTCRVGEGINWIQHPNQNPQKIVTSKKRHERS